MFTFEILFTLIIFLSPLTSATSLPHKYMRPIEIITKANKIKKQHNANENEIATQTNKEAYKEIYDKTSIKSEKWKDLKLHEGTDRQEKYEEADKKTNITRGNKEMMSDDGVVIEHARKRPLMFRGNYDLVSEWTGRQTQGVQSLHPKNHQYSHNRKLFEGFNPGYFEDERKEKRSKENNYEKNIGYRVDYMLKNTNDSENESIFLLEDKEKNRIQEPKGRKREILNMLSLGRNRDVIKKGGKRRHVGQNQAGWRQEWSGDGIFRGVSRCVDIPNNMSLCTGIDYGVMRVPNLLQHDTLREIIDQSSHWTPLMRLKCHRDVQIFLCSLFAPVCLETPVYPCRRTCQAVQLGCEASMKQYNFNWPEFLNCSNFPADTDLCVGLREESEKDLVEVAHASSHQQKGLENHHHNHNSECNMCGGGLNVESFIDHYCEADVVLKTSIQSVKTIRKKVFLIRLRKSDVRIIKGGRRARALFGRRRERIKLQTENCNCTQVVKQLKRYGKHFKNKNRSKMRKSHKLKRYSHIKSKNNVKRMNKFGKRSIYDDSLSSSLPTFSSASSSASSSSLSPSPSSRKREKPRFLLMVRRLSGEWVVVLIQALHPNQHSFKNTQPHSKHPSMDHQNLNKVYHQALKVIRNNHRNICNNIS